MEVLERKIRSRTEFPREDPRTCLTLEPRLGPKPIRPVPSSLPVAETIRNCGDQSGGVDLRWEERRTESLICDVEVKVFECCKLDRTFSGPDNVLDFGSLSGVLRAWDVATDPQVCAGDQERIRINARSGIVIQS